MSDKPKRLSAEEIERVRDENARWKLHHMKRLCLSDPSQLWEALQREDDEREAVRMAVLDEDALDKLQEDADHLDAINEWRLDDDMHTLDTLAKATNDELDAACAGNAKLLLRRQTALR